MRKMLFAIVCVVLLCVGGQLLAQPMPTWTAEQQAVIDAQQGCWDSWFESYDAWIKTCRPVEDLIWWFPKNGISTLKDHLRDGRKWREGLEANRYYHLSPQAIQIFGDTAVMYYIATSLNRQWGTESHVMERRTEIFRKIDGKWCLAGGLVAEVN